MLKTLEEISDTFDYTIHTTLHKNNWQGLPDLFNFTKKYKKWTINLLTYPKNLDIINLEQSDKDKLIKILKTYEIPNRQYIEAHMKGEA